MFSDSSSLIVTGATGYLGSNYLNFLFENNYITEKNSILLLDRTLKTDRLNDWYKKSKLVKMDLNDIKSFTGLITNCHSHVDRNNALRNRSNEKPLNYCIHTAKINSVTAEKYFLDELHKYNPEIYLVYFSSAAVYGDINEDCKIPETHSTVPVSDYGKHKLEIEKYVSEKFPKHLILRIANPYGARAENNGVIKIIRDKFAKFKNENLILEINAEKSNEIIRDFIYIDEFSKAITALIQANCQGIYNIGSGVGRSIEEIIDTIGAGAGCDYSIKYLGYKDGDIKYSVLDIAKLKKFYTPSCELILTTP